MVALERFLKTAVGVSTRNSLTKILYNSFQSFRKFAICIPRQAKSQKCLLPKIPGARYEASRNCCGLFSFSSILSNSTNKPSTRSLCHSGKMGIGSSSNRVTEEDQKKYEFDKALDKLICFDGKFLLFLLETKMSSNGGNFEVLLYNPSFSSKCFRLVVFDDFEVASEKFKQLADHMAPFVKHIKSIYNVEQLQNIIEQFKGNPNWTAAHVAAELEIIECFENEQFMKEMENHLSEEELTPLHLACKDGKSKTIEKLIQLGPNFSKDFFGNTPLHYLVENHPELVEAASSLANVVTSAGEQFKESMNTLNRYSESPVHVAIRLSQEKVLEVLLEKGANSRMLCGHMCSIHLALKHQSDGCVQVLIKSNKDCVHDKDQKYNASPLHWTKSAKCVNLLIENGADFDSLNSDEERPLHVMARKKRLSCIVALISNGADVNTLCRHGRNPLHYAVEAQDVDCIKALLLFGADHEHKDQDGLSAHDLARKLPESLVADDIRKALINFASIHRGPAEEESHTQGLFGQAKSAYTEVKYKVKQSIRGKDKCSVLKGKHGKEAVLCLDGGGIRGLVLTELLFALEEVTGHQVGELFDWISGTSTGSYLALALATGKSIQHCQRAYFRLKDNVFQGGRPFSSETLEQFLIKEFGENTMMNSIDYPRVIIPAIMADRKPAVLHLFRNYEASYDQHFWLRDTRFTRPRQPQELELWRAARCSGAAPTYFRAKGRYLDGGIIANNPTLDVLTEIHNYKKHHKIKEKKVASQQATPRDTAMASDVTVKGTHDNIGVVVSLGTGRPPQQPLEGIDLYKPSSIWETTQVFNSARWFGELLVDQVTNSDDHVVERAKSWCEMVGMNYFRFNPGLSKDVELDENDDKELINMLWETRNYLNKNRDLVQKAGRVLLGIE